MKKVYVALFMDMGAFDGPMNAAKWCSEVPLFSNVSL